MNSEPAAFPGAAGEVSARDDELPAAGGTKISLFADDNKLFGAGNKIGPRRGEESRGVFRVAARRVRNLITADLPRLRIDRRVVSGSKIPAL